MEERQLFASPNATSIEKEKRERKKKGRKELAVAYA